ncbi:hypothetical protein RCL1_007830 [Eukaryota sp. TZLM3-RCL]
MTSLPSSPIRQEFPATASAYVLHEEMGSGASATVYRGHCTTLAVDVAIKIVDLEASSASMEEIRKELQVMSLCSHPNIVTYHVAFVHQHSLWLVMPLLLGSLRDVMRQVSPSGLDEITIATILREILKALEYLHRNGQVHRDVKAGNVLLDDKGYVFLGDFGVCGLLVEHGGRQKRNTFVGTPCWMAPEVIEQRHYSESCDIWSLGITAIELAHGVAPLSKYPPMKVVMLTLQNPPPSLDSVDDGEEKKTRWSRSFREFVDSCLSKDPSKRPTATSLLGHRFIKNMGRKSDYLVNNLIGKYLSSERSVANEPTDPTPGPRSQGVSSPDLHKPISSEWDFGEEEMKEEKEKHSRSTSPKERVEKAEKRGRFTVKEGVSGDEHEPSESNQSNLIEHRGRFALKSTPSISAPKVADGSSKHERMSIDIGTKEALPPRPKTARKDKTNQFEKLSAHLNQINENTMNLLREITDVQSEFLGISELDEVAVTSEMQKKISELSSKVLELTAENNSLKLENAKLKSMIH